MVKQVLHLKVPLGTCLSCLARAPAQLADHGFTRSFHSCAFSIRMETPVTAAAADSDSATSRAATAAARNGDAASEPLAVTKAFLKAARRGEVARLSELLDANAAQAGALLQAADSDGYSALHKAAYNGRCKAVKWLLAR